jgi:phospholipase A1
MNIRFSGSIPIIVLSFSLACSDAVAQPDVSEDTFGGYNPNYVVFGADSINTSEPESDDYCDIKFQISFLSRLRAPGNVSMKPFERFLDFSGPLHFAYTQESYWDFCRQSAPFRESDHRPEFFFKNRYNLGGVTIDGSFGYLHESNGRDGDNSYGWDRAYIRARFPFGKKLPNLRIKTSDTNRWVVDLSVWRPFNISSTNSNIAQFAGYGELSATLTFKDEHRLRLTVRKGGALSKWDRGLGELDWIFPIPKTSLQGLLQFTNGYGASLERYDQQEFSLRLGILFYDFIQPTY